MKKAYMTPEIEVITLNLKNGILFGSATGDGVLDGGGDLGEFEGVQIDAPALLTPAELLGMPDIILQ